MTAVGNGGRLVVSRMARSAQWSLRSSSRMRPNAALWLSQTTPMYRNEVR
jgi:hypothetical protein